MRALGLVREELVGDGVAYGLTHPVIREVAYAELPAMARRRAHASLATALDGDLPIPALLPNERTDRLARHCRGAGAEVDAERALDVLVAAGDRARTLHANDQAADHYEAALALVRGGRRAALLPTLLERLGEAREQIGRGARAIELGPRRWRRTRRAATPRRSPGCTGCSRPRSGTAASRPGPAPPRRGAGRPGRPAAIR